MKGFFAGIVVGIAICAVFFVVFPYQSIPRTLTCGMRTQDGCALWFSQARIERYKNGQAGQRATFIKPAGESA